MPPGSQAAGQPGLSGRRYGSPSLGCGAFWVKQGPGCLSFDAGSRWHPSPGGVATALQAARSASRGEGPLLMPGSCPLAASRMHPGGKGRGTWRAMTRSSQRDLPVALPLGRSPSGCLRWLLKSAKKPWETRALRMPDQQEALGIHQPLRHGSVIPGESCTRLVRIIGGSYSPGHRPASMSILD